jgi:hypothetical protein
MSFGLTSGVITTLGLLVGLSAGTSSRTAVVAGILTIAVADSLSDALGIHMSEESEGVHAPREVWVATLATFGAKLVMALTFATPRRRATSTLSRVNARAPQMIATTVAVSSERTITGIDPKPIVLEHGRPLRRAWHHYHQGGNSQISAAFS